MNIGSRFMQYNNFDFPNLQTTEDNFIYKQNLDRPNLSNTVSVGLNLNKVTSRTDFVIKSSDAYQLYDTDSLVKEYSNIDTIIFAKKNTIPTEVDGYEDYSISQKLIFKFNDKFSATLKGTYYNHNQYDFLRDNTYEKFIDLTYGGKFIYNFNSNTSLTGSYNSDTYDKYNQSEITNSSNKIYSHRFRNPRLIFNINSGKQTITKGLEFISETLITDKFTYDTFDEKSTETYIAFVQDDIKLTDKLNFIAGLRGDYHTTFGFHASPKLSIMYKINPFTIRANFANGFRAPSLKELYMNWDHLGMFQIQGSENLKPETNNYYSLSTEYTKNKFNGSITIYHNRFKDKIEGQWTANETMLQYINVHKSNVSGAEVALKYRLLRSLYISSGYSYLYDNNSADGVRLSTVSPHSANIRLEYKFKKGFYNTTINLSGKIYGSKNFDVSEEIIFSGEMVNAVYQVDYSPYSILKFTLSQNLFNGGNLIFGIDNLLDYKAEIITFNTSTSPGRRFFISLNISFDKLLDYRKTLNK
ncbi:MAG: TonB-dependent receptor [Bacteroidetes bacterium]|nr:TonB-dependent receptor [Bacteroidota bacterium]